MTCGRCFAPILSRLVGRLLAAGEGFPAFVADDKGIGSNRAIRANRTSRGLGQCSMTESSLLGHDVPIRPPWHLHLKKRRCP